MSWRTLCTPCSQQYYNSHSGSNPSTHVWMNPKATRAHPHTALRRKDTMMPATACHGWAWGEPCFMRSTRHRGQTLQDPMYMGSLGSQTHGARNRWGIWGWGVSVSWDGVWEDGKVLWMDRRTDGQTEVTGTGEGAGDRAEGRGPAESGSPSLTH